MAALVFDTETTGLPPYRGAPAAHPGQPHIIQLAALLLDDDFNELCCLSVLVKPPVLIPLQVSRLTGIDDEMVARFGVPPMVAMAMWSHLARAANVLVAHNIEFDIDMVEAMWLRTARQDGAATWAATHATKQRYCTKEAAAPLVNLPPTQRMIETGRGNQPKAPTLEECIWHFFREPLAGAHNGLVDARACARVYRHLVAPPPEDQNSSANS